MKSSILRLRDEVTDVIIPTYNNPDQLMDCLGSMMRSYYSQPIRIIIVNNGKHSYESSLAQVKQHILIIKPETNLGWEGGLKEGLKHSHSKYVVFANDDIFIPRSEIHWLRCMMRDMELYERMAAIGPTSNVVMGQQNIWSGPFGKLTVVPFLIGFCVLVRRKALDEVGGIDDTLPGGDDLDLSIRFRKAGWELGVMKDVFIYHHGFQTGSKLFGGPEKPGGWNSRDMTDRTNDALIRKHGFLDWWKTVTPVPPEKIEFPHYKETQDKEGAECLKYVQDGKTLELGVGANRTVPGSVGVDLVPPDKGAQMYGDDELKSVADVVADVQYDMPVPLEGFENIIARHILEHCIDPIATLRNWVKYLKRGGRMIISLPDQRLGDWLIAHPDHLHAFIPEVLDSMVEAIGGLKRVGFSEFYNGVSFTTAYEKA